MRRSRSVLLSVLGSTLLASALVAVPPIQRPSKQYTIEQFLETVSITGASFTSDEKSLLYSSNRTGIYNVNSVPVAGGAAAAMTDATKDSTFLVSAFPQDNRFLYTRDQGGNERNHLYVQSPGSAERDLTPGEKLKADFVDWTHSGDGLYVQTNERDERYFDLYLYDAKSYQRRLIYQNDVGYDLGAISDDGQWLAFRKTNSTSDSDMFLWSVARKEMKLLSKHEGVANYRPAAFDPDGQWLYYLTNDGSEFMRVARYELATGKTKDVEKADWDIEWTFFSHNGKYRLSAVNADGRSVLHVFDGRTGTPIALPPFPAGEISSVRVSRSETKLAFELDGDRGPNNLYLYEFGAKAPVRLTDTMSKDIDPEDLVEGRVVRFRSFDGMEIPNIFYQPYSATPGAKAPALVWVHGGPGGQTRRQYSAPIQYLVNHGYVILGINNRGSSGYGKTFNTADDHKHGREPLWDCVAAKKYLQTLPEVDPNRIGIIGGSYGGYMVLAALAFQPDVFEAGVDLFGISNWIRTLESIPKWWEGERIALYKEIGDPEKDRDFLKETSPLFHADAVRKPLMVVQGANDPRVIQSESDDIVTAVKKRGVPVEYLVFPDEGHGFSKKANQIVAWRSIREFLDKYLANVPAKASAASGR